MAETIMAALGARPQAHAAVDVLCKGSGGETDFLRQAVHHFVQELMEEEVTAIVGAERYERSDERTTQRNGVRHRQWDTRVGTLDLAIPKLRTGSYFPAGLSPGAAPSRR